MASTFSPWTAKILCTSCSVRATGFQCGVGFGSKRMRLPILLKNVSNDNARTIHALGQYFLRQIQRPAAVVGARRQRKTRLLVDCRC
jgi:hypothetical protein